MDTTIEQALGDAKKWEEAEANIAQIEADWKSDSECQMHDIESMRETMKNMGLEKELAQFDTTYQQLQDEERAATKQKRSKTKPDTP